jgi:hypothetical protein
MALVAFSRSYGTISWTGGDSSRRTEGVRRTTVYERKRHDEESGSRRFRATAGTSLLGLDRQLSSLASYERLRELGRDVDARSGH